MQIKRLELYGFKTFAKRTTIEFTSGMSAIVGPNGSGKSNIVDAVRWVLGEQSAKTLRGAKMHDVIFKGSDAQRPLNFAEVTIVFDNQSQTLPLEYQEVSITRRVYRSGESEYLLNKQQVRLQDIHQLFLDTGVGKSSFSIIGQGQVARILDSKPIERRSIFEEAAQVSKYKNRKEQALKKLRQTQEHLVRVHDIMQELKSQVDALEQQATTAKQYVKIQEQLEFLQLHVFVADIRTQHKRYDELKQALTQWQESDAQALLELDRLERIVHEQQDAIGTLETKIQHDQTTFNQLSQQLEAQKAQQQILDERQQTLNNNLSRQHEEEARIAGQLEAVKTTLQTLQIENQSLAQKIVTLQNKETGYREAITEQQRELRQDQQQLRQNQQRCTKKQAELEALEQITNSFKNLHAGTKHVLLAKRQEELIGICGAVVELIETDTRFDLALETALGGALQHIVVDRDRDAQQAIEYLKREQRGRATFLPLNTMKARTLSEQQIQIATEQPGFIGVASELVRALTKYKPVIESLLGQTLVVEDLDAAMPLAKKLQYRTKIVTLDGEIINAGGSFTGGRQNNQRNGLLSQRHQIDELQKEIALLVEKVAADEQKVTQVMETLRVMEANLQQLQFEVITIQTNQSAKKDQKEQVKGQLRHFQEEKKRLDRDLSTAETDQYELVDLVKEHNQKIAYQVAALAKQSEGLQALQQEKVTVQATIAAEQVEIKALRIQTKGVSQQLRTTEIELNRVEVTLQTQLQQLSEVYHLTFEAADAKIGTQVLPTYARQEVFQLQKQLKKLGTVNLGAIEEFERLMERFTYLQTQSQDLETARDNLLTVIDEMDQEMNQRFQATFTQIQAAFADVFTQMFGGGTAQLVLTEAEYEDERGIELHVQPPGKKMQHLSLLSGGERALTAICLLFAIIR
ncbi:MAG: AAA family ATPase, partial [Culicoidibacterales bacterium]